MKRSQAALVVAVAAAGSLWLGARVTEAQASGAAQAALGTAWGEPDLVGVWQAAKLGARPGKDTFNLTQLERLYRPEVRDKLKQLPASDDPALNCFPQSFPRAVMFGSLIQILQRPNKVFVFNEAFHTLRVIPTHGRHVGEDFQFPMFLGDSAGRWEGTTLVVDVISFNGQSWLAGSQDKTTQASLGVWPTSDALHVTERWRRVDVDTLEYQARVEDPAMLIAPWDTPTVIFKRQPLDRVSEAKCLRDDPGAPASTYLNQFGR